MEPVDTNPDKLQDFWEWLVEYRNQVVLAILIALGGGMIWYVGKVKKQTSEEAAAGELHAVLSPSLDLAGTTDTQSDSEKLQGVVGANPDTAAAVNAAYLKASALFKERDYAGAEQAFQTFYATHGTHTLAAGALFGKAASMHAQSKPVNDLQSAYKAVVSQFPTSAEADQARVALARMLESTDAAKAREYIDDVTKVDENFVLGGFWATEAERLDKALPGKSGAEPEKQPEPTPDPGLQAPAPSK